VIHPIGAGAHPNLLVRVGIETVAGGVGVGGRGFAGVRPPVVGPDALAGLVERVEHEGRSSAATARAAGGRGRGGVIVTVVVVVVRSPRKDPAVLEKGDGGLSGPQRHRRASRQGETLGGDLGRGGPSRPGRGAGVGGRRRRPDSGGPGADVAGAGRRRREGSVPARRGLLLSAELGACQAILQVGRGAGCSSVGGPGGPGGVLGLGVSRRVARGCSRVGLGRTDLIVPFDLRDVGERGSVERGDEA